MKLMVKKIYEQRNQLWKLINHVVIDPYRIFCERDASCA